MTALDTLAAAELITVAARLSDAIQETLSYVQRLTEAAAQLEGHTCTGSPYWRDKDAPGRMPKLYVIHGVDQICPLHGVPEPGGRVRTYVGSGPEKQTVAFAAIEAEERRQRLSKERRALNATLWQAKSDLRQLLADLGYDPESGRPMTPERAYSVEDLLRR